MVNSAPTDVGGYGAGLDTRQAVELEVRRPAGFGIQRDEVIAAVFQDFNSCQGGA